MISEFDAPGILVHLERLGEALGIIIRYESLGRDDDTVPTNSGLCVVHDRPVVLIDSRLNSMGRVLALVDELKRFDLSSVFIPPILRQLLENSPEDF